MAFGLPHISFIGYPAPIPCAGHAGLGFREAHSADAPAILDHLRRLGPEDRRMRYCATISDEALAHEAARIFERADFALCAFDGPLWNGPFHRAGPIRAVAEFVISGRQAELGLSVDVDLRRRGVGAYLVQTASRLLAPRGVRTVTAYTLPQNRAMIALGLASGARIERGPEEVEIDFDVAALEAAYLRRRAAQVFRPIPLRTETA